MVSDCNITFQDGEIGLQSNNSPKSGGNRTISAKYSAVWPHCDPDIMRGIHYIVLICILGGNYLKLHHNMRRRGKK